MAYEPKTWQCGEVVTADDLNRIERGIAEAGGGALIVEKSSVTCPLNASASPLIPFSTRLGKR